MQKTLYKALCIEIITATFIVLFIMLAAITNFVLQLPYSGPICTFLINFGLSGHSVAEIFIQCYYISSFRKWIIEKFHKLVGSRIWRSEVVPSEHRSTVMNNVSIARVS